MKNVLLIGNPNVGKSVLFSRLTGVGVVASNYPGTTVEFCTGCLGTGEQKLNVLDAPGTYGLEPTSPAEQVAVEMLEKAIKGKDSIVINVIDATNLERNLNLTLQLLKKEIPVIIALNLWDETKHLGIAIDVEKLQSILGVEIVPTVAVTGEGIKSLVLHLPEARIGTYEYESGDRWLEIGRIVEQVQVIKHRHHTIFERLGDLTVNSWTGIPVAIGVMFLVFNLVRLVGEGLINLLCRPFFENLWRPVMDGFSQVLGRSGIAHSILVGQLIGGRIDFSQSFGILTTGLYVEFAQVLPYVISFYLVLSFMEDSGYLPRLAVLLDKLMHSVGLHGMAIVPTLLGFGCNVPGVMATRILETRRERFIAATLLSISVPCMALNAMIFGLVGKYGARGLFPVFATLAAVWLIGGMLMNAILKGESPEIFTEIPAYRFPHLPTLAKKLWIRIVWFLKDATPFVLLGVLIVNLLYSSGGVGILDRFLAPIVKTVLGLPGGAVAALVVGFLRKDVAVGMLVPLSLSLKQLIIASVVLSMYFPCVATFAVLLKELGLVNTAKAAVIMAISALVVGAILNLVL